MRLNPFFLPLLAMGALLGSVLVAQAQGQWSISGRTAVDLQSLAPEDLKGWMTLQQVMDGLGIAQADLYALMNIPADVPPSTALKDLEAIVEGFEVSLLREKLTEWLSGPAPAASPTAVAPPPTALPVATATPIIHSGDGSGTGPTPLPPGQVLPANQIKGRMTLAEVSTQCAVPLEQLLTALNLPAQTDPNTQIKSLIEQGLLVEVTAVQTAVAALQP